MGGEALRSYGLVLLPVLLLGSVSELEDVSSQLPASAAVPDTFCHASLP